MKTIYSFLLIGILTFPAINAAGAEYVPTAATTLTAQEIRNREALANQLQLRIQFISDTWRQREAMLASDLQKVAAMHTNSTPVVLPVALPGLTLAELSCVSSAIATRETTIQSALRTYSSSIHSAYSIRSTDLNTAWTLTGRIDRQQAVNLAWKNWRTDMKTAQNNYRTTIIATWKAYRTGVRVCGLPEAIREGGRVLLENRVGMR